MRTGGEKGKGKGKKGRGGRRSSKESNAAELDHSVPDMSGILALVCALSQVLFID
jgi:hypothetical protein